MESYLSIFQGILSTEGKFLDFYLEGLAEHRKFGVQLNDGAELMQHISSLLTNSSTRILGLRLLSKFLDQCSVDVLENKGNLWITLTLKACNHQDLQLNAPLIFDVLGKLIKRTQESPDLTKTFTSTHISKVYESLTNSPVCKAKYALNCIEICLRTYPGSSGPSRGIVERFLWKNVDNDDNDVVKNCGKCLHLLQQIKGGSIQGINHKTQWKNYQLQLLGGIHSVYNEMFANCIEMYEEKIEQEQLPWEKEQEQFEHEPVKKAAQMYIRCHNLIQYLTIALREPFPVEKPILIKKILNVISRGLNVNSIMLEQNPIADNIALSILLPKLHVNLLDLLNTAVIILRGHLRPYSELILGLIVDALKWTSAKNAHGNQKLLSVLRKKIYETVSLWCKILYCGSRSETIAEYLFQEILRDVTPTQNEFTLKVLSGARKHMSKKARRQLHNAQNEKSNMSQTHSRNNNNLKSILTERRSQELCISALRCLQEILFSAANFIKPTILKMMQTNITQICAVLYELPLKTDHLYSNIDCRIEIYNVLFAIVMTPHHLCPPPTEMALAIIQTVFTRDDSLKVRTHCWHILKNVEKLVHPQKESLLFAIEARDIRNTFIKMGQENLLHEFGISFSNANIVNGDKDVDLNNSTNLNASNDSISNSENDQIKNNEQHPSENDSISNSENDQIENNEQHPSENNEPIQSESTESIVVNISDNNDKANVISSTDKIEIQLIEKENNDNQELNYTNCTENIPKSPEIVLRVDDDGEITKIDEEDSNIEDRIVEPVTKKQKLDNEDGDGNEKGMDVVEKINQFNVEDDEDNLLAEIASQFVDELD